MTEAKLVNDGDDEDVSTNDATHEELSTALSDAANKILEENDLDAVELETVMDNFERALELDSKNIDAYIGKAFVLGLQDKYHEGKLVLEAAKIIVPSDNRIDDMLQQLENDMKTANEDEQDIPSLVEKGVMTKGFYDVLMTVFDHFDQDHDDALDEKELEAFYQTVNGEPLNPAVVDFLTRNFSIDSKGHLTREGFMEFYLSQTAGEPSETWNDLEKLGFDKQLNPVDARYKKV